MTGRIKSQYPVFEKFTRDWLHEQTTAHEQTRYAKTYLSRVASGKVPLTRSFIDRVCGKLNMPEEALFSTTCNGPGGCAKNALGTWLENRCRQEHLSLRKVAARTGLSHATIEAIIKGGRPSLVTIKMLARGFAGNGENSAALEKHLIELVTDMGEKTGESYLNLIPLLSGEHQRIVKSLVKELAQIEGLQCQQ